MAFAFRSYLHLFFWAGSYIDPLYDRLRQTLVPKEKVGYQRAKRIKQKGESADAPVMNVFQGGRRMCRFDVPPRSPRSAVARPTSLAA